MYFLVMIIIIVLMNKMASSGLISSFRNFKDKLVNFFDYTNFTRSMKRKALYYCDLVKYKKQKIKKAYHNFIAEIKSKEMKNTTRLLHSNLRSGDIPHIETNMSAAQLITFHGYQSETHFVQTRDGYNLEIHRILPYSLKTVRGKESVALLHHGFMGSSDDWLLQGPTRALPYLLSDAGYDVWLTNARGNKYSRFDYDYLYHDSNILWDFSFHEMGYFDLAAVIDFIETRTKNALEINFVGHSLGGTVLLTLLSTQPQYNRILKSATLLAPLAFMIDIQGPLKMLADFYKENGPTSLDFLGKHEFLARKNFPRQFIDAFCISSLQLCYNPLLFLSNGGKMNADKDFLELLLSHTPAGTSSKTIKHYLQLINSGLFQYYEYEHENLKKYGTVDTPFYNVSKITVPLILFTSLDDWLSTPPGIAKLLKNLHRVPIHHVIVKPGFSHTDFVWGDAESIYKILMDILDTMR